MPSLLLTAAPAATILPAEHVAPIAPPLAAPPWRGSDAGMKELAVGDDQDTRYAARQAGIEQAYAALPPPGTPAYWEALKGVRGEAPPLEALVRCYRERDAAGARDQAERIFALVMGRSEQPTRYWASKIAQHAPASARHDLEAELEQACYVELWRVMKDSHQAFILVNFHHMLQRIQDHMAHDVMEREGHWKRRGVGTPRRVPSRLTERLDGTAREDDDPDATARPVPDQGAQEAFDRAELKADVEEALASLPPENRALLVDLFWRGFSQDEIATKLNITDRTVRNRLTRILAYLRQMWPGLEEDLHGD